MKKATIVLPFLLIVINVDAKINYTDYKFVEYIRENRRDDELNKYEQTTMHKFYNLVESDSEYSENDEDSLFEFKDENDFIINNDINEVFRPNESAYRNVTVKVEDNFIESTIDFKNIANYDKLDIREIECYVAGKRLDITVKSKGTDCKGMYDGDLETTEKLRNKEFYIYFLDGAIDISKVNVVMYVGNLNVMESDLVLTHTTGVTKFKVKTNILTNGLKKINIDFLNTNNFNRLASINNLTNNGDILYYFTYPKKLFKYYNLKKEYYLDSEEEEIKGYMYDKKEDYVVYKHYVREKIDVKEDDLDIDYDIEDKMSNDSKEEANSKHEFYSENMEPLKIKTNFKKKKNNVNSNENDVNQETNNLDGYFDEYEIEEKVIEANTGVKSEEENECSKNRSINFWFILSCIFAVISIIFDIKHYKSVKSMKEY